MNVTERKNSGITVIEIHGSFELMEAEKVKKYIKEHIESNNENKLIFDFRGTSYVDSSAVGLIVRTTRQILGKNGNVAVINLQDNIKGILETMNLLSIINVFDDEKKAIDFLKS